MSNFTAPMALQTATVRYADIINNRYKQSGSNYVDIQTRIENSMGRNECLEVLIKDAVENCRARNSTFQNWNDIPLCESLTAPMSNMVIDTTMQRTADLEHIANILDIFDPFKVRPILVYRNPECPDKLVVWDGQHTLICLYLFARRLNLNIDDCHVPVVINRSTDKDKMRETFMCINDDGIRPLDLFDKIEQMLYAVQSDNVTRPSWVLISDKQQALTRRGIFLTHEKFGDHGRPGAYSRLEEFYDTKYSLNVVDNFAEYFYQVCRSSRPVHPKEVWMLYEFFRLCEREKIKVDKSYIKGVADSLRVVGKGKDFHAIDFYARAKASYQEWWRLHKPNPDGTLLGASYAEHPIGLTFLRAQIKKNFNGPLPVSPKYFNHWSFPDSDLF